MMYNNYYKKDIIIIPKNKQNNIKSLDKNDIKLKDKSYDNIRDIVINKKKDIEKIPENNSKNNIYIKKCRQSKLAIKIYKIFFSNSMYIWKVFQMA